jgi:cytochrome c-type biogenesis protein CcmH
MTALRALVVAIALSLVATVAAAVQPSEMLKDPALEARARALSTELRCMVCQNQSIDDSDASLAADIRVLLRERIVAGDSDDQVRNFLVARYGEFILLKPPFSWHSAILWIAPSAALFCGGLLAWYGYRRRQPVPVVPLDANEVAALQRLTSEDR